MIKLGPWGEDWVASQYLDRGYKLVDRNWRTRYGELDIIMENDTHLVFIEVKTRRNKKFGEGFESVDEIKQDKLTTTAELFMMEFPTEKQVRFDVVSVFAPKGVETEEPELVFLEAAF